MNYRKNLLAKKRQADGGGEKESVHSTALPRPLISRVLEGTEPRLGGGYGVTGVTRQGGGGGTGRRGSNKVTRSKLYHQITQGERGQKQSGRGRVSVSRPGGYAIFTRQMGESDHKRHLFGKTTWVGKKGGNRSEGPNITNGRKKLKPTRNENEKATRRHFYFRQSP